MSVWRGIVKKMVIVRSIRKEKRKIGRIGRGLCHFEKRKRFGGTGGYEPIQFFEFLILGTFPLYFLS